MTIRSLRNEVRRLAGNSTAACRCLCGAILPPDLLCQQPPAMREEYRPPDAVEALLPLATPDEARELQALLNRCLELRPDRAALQEDAGNYRDFGSAMLPDVGEYPLRFRFADKGDAGASCPRCGAEVIREGIHSIHIMAPTPDRLLDALQSEPSATARFAELETAWRRRMGS
jgi:hypothetical protein